TCRHSTHFGARQTGWIQVPVDLYLEIDDEFEDELDEETIRAVVDATFAHLHITDAELTVVITDDNEVQALNREYRDIDAPTDVIIAFPYARRQALQYGNSPADEILLLVTHGVLHLLGYDHATAEEEAEMWVLQEAILEPFGVEGISGRDYEE